MGPEIEHCGNYGNESPGGSGQHHRMHTGEDRWAEDWGAPGLGGGAPRSRFGACDWGWVWVWRGMACWRPRISRSEAPRLPSQTKARGCPNGGGRGGGREDTAAGGEESVRRAEDQPRQQPGTVPGPQRGWHRHRPCLRVTPRWQLPGAVLAAWPPDTVPALCWAVGRVEAQVVRPRAPGGHLPRTVD